MDDIKNNQIVWFYTVDIVTAPPSLHIIVPCLCAEAACAQLPPASDDTLQRILHLIVSPLIIPTTHIPSNHSPPNRVLLGSSDSDNSTR